MRGAYVSTSEAVTPTDVDATRPAAGGEERGRAARAEAAERGRERGRAGARGRRSTAPPCVTLCPVHNILRYCAVVGCYM